jgi:hypothetical protein
MRLSIKGTGRSVDEPPKGGIEVMIRVGGWSWRGSFERQPNLDALEMGESLSPSAARSDSIIAPASGVSLIEAESPTETDSPAPPTEGWAKKPNPPPTPAKRPDCSFWIEDGQDYCAQW